MSDSPHVLNRSREGAGCLGVFPVQAPEIFEGGRKNSDQVRAKKFTYMYHKNPSNVGKYTYHTWMVWDVKSTLLKNLSRNPTKMTQPSLYIHRLSGGMIEKYDPLQRYITYRSMYGIFICLHEWLICIVW